MRRPPLVVALTALVFVVLAVLLFSRPLFQERTRIASVATPSPVLVESPVELPAGKRLCITRTLLSPRGGVVELVISDKQRRATPALDVVAQGPGYRSPVARIPAGPAGRHAVTARIQPPDRDIIGELCVRAHGKVTLVGTTEFRTITRSISEIDGTPIEPDPALTFFVPEPVSAAAELGGIVDRMTIARGFLGASWIVWALLVLVVVGVPAAVLTAFGRALRDG